MKRILPGEPYSLGATWDGKPVNFMLYSEHAEKATLRLFDSPSATQESERLELPECSDTVGHGCLRDAPPGQLCVYRAHGLHEPKTGR